MGRTMSEILGAINELNIDQIKKNAPFTDEERLWLIATILILSEKSGLVTFRRPTKGKQTDVVPLPEGLISLLEACEKQGLIAINRKKLQKLDSRKRER